jgi:AcrR family transcriptional regulator
METCTGLIMYHTVHSVAMVVKSPRARLLQAAVDYVLEHGISDLSLRALATELGTSHRMLIHHFGSKEALWIEIVHAVEARQREVLESFLPDPTAAASGAAWSWWKHISDPALWPAERLFFELYGQAIQGRHAHFLDGIVENWVDPIAQGHAARGLGSEAARAQARLDVAVTRGLLLDLLATGDTAGVDAAMAAYLDSHGWP